MLHKRGPNNWGLTVNKNLAEKVCFKGILSDLITNSPN